MGAYFSNDGLAGKKGNLSVHLVNSLFYHIKRRFEFNLELAWAGLDERKRGVVGFEDFRGYLRKVGFVVSNADAAEMFGVLKGKEEEINFYGFLEGWREEEEGGKRDGRGRRKEEEEKGGWLGKLEEEVMEHLKKVLEQREEGLEDYFNRFDIAEKGELDIAEVRRFFVGLGLQLEEDVIIQLLRIIDKKAVDTLKFVSLVKRLGGCSEGGDERLAEKGGGLEHRVDKSLKKMMMGLEEKTRRGVKIKEFFDSFDANMDGLLEPMEFIMALSKLGLTRTEGERLGNMWKNGEGVQISRLLLEWEHKKDVESKTREDGISEEMFKQLMVEFDAFQVVSRMIREIKGFAGEIKGGMEGYALYANQNSLKEIEGKIHRIWRRVEVMEGGVRRNVHASINESTARRIIEKKTGRIDIERTSVLAVESQELKKIKDPGQFKVEEEVLALKHEMVRGYKGFSFISNKQVDILCYGKEILRRICVDGNKFEEALDFELKLQSFLSEKFRVFLPNEGSYEKRIGVGQGDKELYVLSEKRNPEDFISLKELIEQNGGLLRIPFLVKTNAITFILKYYAGQILRILSHLHNFSACLPLITPSVFLLSLQDHNLHLSKLHSICKVNENGRFLTFPDLELNAPLLDGSSKAERKDEKMENKADFSVYMRNYIAPELMTKKWNENDLSCESWSFGVLLFELIFGEIPYNYNESEQTSFYQDLFKQRLTDEIVRYDFDMKLGDETKDDLAEAAEKNSFGALFKRIFDEESREFKDLGEIINIMALCLEKEAFKRPSIEDLLKSKTLNLDNFEENTARQFAECLTFYKSPSKNILERTVLPLRKICASILKSEKSAVNFKTDLIIIMDVFMFSIIEKNSKKLENLKKNISFPKYNNTSESHHAREKLPNYVLLKFAFDNDLLDLLVFSILKLHKVDKDGSLPHLKSLRDIFKMLLFQMSSYESAAAPYIEPILMNLCKIYIGETASLFNPDPPTPNFFRRTYDSNKFDEADSIFSSQKRKHYIFCCGYWSPTINLIFGPIYKDSISEAGVGKSNYPVIQDFIRKSVKRNVEFDLEGKLQNIEEKLEGRCPRTPEYYNDLVGCVEVLEVVQSQQEKGKARMKMAVGYVKGILESNNRAKVKLKYIGVK